MWKPLQWIVNLFRRERSKLRSKLKPFALAVAEDLFHRDFNRDGEVADARIELGKLLRVLTTELKNTIFDEYFARDGSLRSDVIEMLPRRSLKKVLAIARLVSALRERGWPIPLPAILKHGYSLLDTVLQDAYEDKVEPPAPSSVP